MSVSSDVLSTRFESVSLGIYFPKGSCTKYGQQCFFVALFVACIRLRNLRIVPYSLTQVTVK